MWSIPLLCEEGLRHQVRVAKPPQAAQTGAKRGREARARQREAVIVVSSAKSSGLNSFAELTTPAAPFRNGSIFIYGASTPPLRGGE